MANRLKGGVLAVAPHICSLQSNVPADQTNVHTYRNDLVLMYVLEHEACQS